MTTITTKLPYLNLSTVRINDTPKNREGPRNLGFKIMRDKYSGKYRVLGKDSHNPQVAAMLNNRDSVKNFLKERTTKLPPIKDLTRYGVESNPGPTMATIMEELPYFEQHGIYSFCQTCYNTKHLMAFDKLFFISRSNCDHCMFVAQSLSEEARNDIKLRIEGIRSWLYDGSNHGKSFYSHYFTIPADIDRHVNLLEDVVILMHNFLQSRSTADRYIAIVNFCKLRGSRIGFTTTLLYVVSEIFGKVSSEDKLHSAVTDRLNYTSQADDDNGEDNIFSEARKYLSCYEKMKETAIYKKTYKFMLYVLSLGLLEGVKIDFNSLNFSQYEANAIKQTHKPGLDMIHCFLETILFICDKGIQYFKTGNSEVFFHSGSSYERWLTKANKLIFDAKFLNNPEPHNVNRFTFLSDLKDVIEKGSAILKFTSGLDKQEKIYLMRILNDLRMIEAEQLTRKAAQMPRKDPFAVLIHGSSSICKSQLKQILFYHYGKCFDLPTTADYMYTRCPTDEYWSGFNSTQWCIVMDDIAFLKPNGEVDPTLKEMLQVKNSVPYTPPQASLEDKGRTPVRAELIIGTTNTKGLNLHAYFACPFAIARRMSYVITAHIKPEFSKNNFMADSNKIPITPDGEYMNIWNFDVSIPVPATDIEVDNQQSKYVVTHTFTDIHDLLSWYITVAKEHEVAQNKALTADKTMMSVSVCQKCYRATAHCLCYSSQTEELTEEESILKYLEDKTTLFQCQMWIVSNVIKGCALDDPEWLSLASLKLLGVDLGDTTTFYLSTLAVLCLGYYGIWCLLLYHFAKYTYMYMWIFLNSVARFSFGVAWKYRLLMWITNSSEEAYLLMFRLAGERIKRVHFTNKTLVKLAAFISAPLFILTLRKMWSVKKTDDFPQGSVGSVPISMPTEKPTFYYNNTYVNTNVEISGASKCAQGDILDKLVKKNYAKLIFRATSSSDKFSAVTGLNIHGCIWMFNKHTLKGNTGTVSVIFDDVQQNVSRNVHDIVYCEKDLFILNGTDLAFIEIKALPPGASLIKYFSKDRISGKYSGKYNLITKSGEKSEKEISNIQPGYCPIFGISGYHGKVNIPTIDGDCGAVCIAKIGNSQVLLGTHTSGSPAGGIFFQSVYQDMLYKAIQKYAPQVESGTIPISAPGYERKIIPLHDRSCIRFLESGTAHVMGSFAGYRPKHKSRVKDTYIKDYVVANGYKAECGPPDMTWKPWHLAIKDMVKPSYTFNNQTLSECGDAFFNDIVFALGDKINQLEVYTQDVALNGVDGVTFVDMLNTSTSAGNPFKCSKKNFIKLTEGGKIESIDPIIQDRIDAIEDCYSQGKRFHPQFCAHLKDEPTPLRKVALGKTRVFTGGEFAWSVVVRRYLLSHIRLIQNNPFVFEAMPGIVAQSKEWNRLYEYLIEHGQDRIIAGDYGKFDKKMAAAFILEAFRILERLAAKAGWKEEDLVYIRCIAYDTAFPTIDFNGDLIEIQGNPSGHPLTVIINCLVNSLYMRYAFLKISGKSVSKFRKYVNLATYGDDNIMSVSPKCPNFNHTRISVIMKLIGVEYTMADKEAESRPYIDIQEASFLKRKFVFDLDIGTVVAPLDHSSFDKMLTSRLDEGTLDERAHAICVIETALREYFFYGRDIFDSKRDFFRKLVEDCNLQDWVEKSTFPTYTELRSAFYDRLKDYPDHDIKIWKLIKH